MGPLSIRQRIFIVFAVLMIPVVLQGLYALGQLTSVSALALGMEESWYHVLALVSAGATAVAALVTASLVLEPVRRLSGAMRSLADGDISVEIPHRGHSDEFGAIAETLESFKLNKAEADRLVAEQRAHQADREKRTAALEALLNGFDQNVQGVLGAVTKAAEQMQTVSRAMTTVAEDTTERATSVTSAAEEASGNVETVATAAEELSASIAEIGRQVARSSDVAKSAVDEATRATGVINDLAETSQKIGDIVSLITDIASQTNLLALNATIEAARAGDAGKGFAVVANEVKALATQTARATDEISQQIASVQDATRDAVEAIEKVNQTIGTISEIAADITAGVQEQAAATHEIARSVEQAARGTSEVTAHIHGVREAAGESGHQAHDVLTTADTLRREAESLQKTVRSFLAEVRAA